MSTSVAPGSGQRKRVREEQDTDDEVDYPSFGEESRKRAKYGESEADVSVEGITSVNDTAEEEFNPLGMREAMVDEAEETKAKKTGFGADGDTSGWTLRELITKRVVGQEPTWKEDGEGGRKAQTKEIGLPSVRAASSRPATIDVDPALNFYEPPAMQVRIGADGRVELDTSTAVIKQLGSPDEGPRREVQGGRIHVTSATYAKRVRSERWTEDDVELLYEALSMCGTDFSMVEVFFPTRTRAHVKARFKKEEKENPQRVEAALKARKPIDVEYFKELIALKKEASNPTAKANASAPRSKASSRRASAVSTTAPTPAGVLTPSSAHIAPTTPQPTSPPKSPKQLSPSHEDQEKPSPAPPPIPQPRPVSPVNYPSPPHSPDGFAESTLNFDDIG